MAGVSTRFIKGRIKSIKNIQKITRAMMLVACAKLAKAEANIKKAGPYAMRLQEIIQDIATRAERNHPFLMERKQKRELVIVVSSERGLCGSFNTNVLKEADNFLKNRNLEVFLLTVGKKGFEHFKKRARIIRQYRMPEKGALEVAGEIGDYITNGYLSFEWDKVSLIYNEFTSMFRQKPRIFQLIPFIPKERQKWTYDYIYEPDANTCFSSIFPLYFKFQIFRVLLSSYAAECAARMLAMDNATRNAENLIKELFLTFNQARQAKITKEITEITSASEAL